MEQTNLPPFLAPVLKVIAVLDPFRDRLPEILSAGRLQGLRRTMVQTVAAALAVVPPGWSEAEVVTRGLAYAAAVGAYIEATSPAFPLDPHLVAANGYLCPALCPRGSEPQAPDPTILVDPAGGVYADPLRVVALKAFPLSVVGVLLGPTATGTAAEAVSVETAAKRLHGSFCWSLGSFPVAGATLEDGTLLLRLSDSVHRWTQVKTTPLPDDSLSAGVGDLPAAEETSALKGARGEARVREVLAREGWTIRETSQKARSADMIVEAPAGLIYVEVKDYAIPVPDKEVAKFRHDLGARGAAAGVLVSLSTKIVGIRKALCTRLEALPTEGRLVPVVYVASGDPGVIAAGVELAAQAAKGQPGPLPPLALHGQDALEAYAAGLEEIADQYSDAQADLGRVAATAAGSIGDVLEKTGGALRDLRRLARAQRAAVEAPEEVLGGAPAIWEEIARRYAPGEKCRPALEDVLRALEEPALGEAREFARWRFLKQKAVHTATETSLSFLKTRVDLGVPVARVGPDALAGLLGRHPKKVRLADGVLALELDEDTAADALSLFAA